MLEVSFARKYRPRTIHEYLGNGVKGIIASRYRNEANFPNVILLHGTRGTGKTTCARLLVKEYLCLNRTTVACGECEMCQEVDENLINAEFGVTVYGVQEVDIANESGKNEIREILDEAVIEPMPPLKYKVLILDEFHRATKQSQNALLKIIEEPPKHLIFILCTTNPEDIIDTILSRCQLKIEVKKAELNELVDRLMFICKQEGIKTSLEALRMIVKKEERIPRNSIMLLEAVAKNYGNNVLIENVVEYTGELAIELYLDYYKSANESLEKIMLFNAKLKKRDISATKFLRGLIRFTLDCIAVKYAIGIEDMDIGYINTIKAMFKIYNSEQLDILLQTLEHAIRIVDSDEAKGELILTTTALRIGRIKLTVVNTQQKNKENDESLKNYREIQNIGNVEAYKEAMGSQEKGIDLTELLTSGAVMVDSKMIEGLVVEETDDKFTDEDLFEIFGNI